MKRCSVQEFPSEGSDNEDETEEDLETFYCAYAVASRQGLFYDLDWPKHRQHAISTKDIRPDAWDILPIPKTAKSKKRKTRPLPATPRRAKKVEAAEGSEDEGHASGEDQKSNRRQVPLPRTPSRKAKKLDSDVDESSGEDYAGGQSSSEEEIDEEVLSDDSEPEHTDDSDPDEPKSRKRKRTTAVTRTPRKRSRTIAHPTPHSKRTARARRKSQGSSPRKKRQLRLLAPATYTAEELNDLPKDPWLRAMHLLHVGNRPGAPGALKGRETEYERILREVSELIEAGQGGCVCGCLFLLRRMS